MIDFFNIPNLTEFMQIDLVGSLNEVYNREGSIINSYMIDLINNELLSYGGQLSNHLIGTACALGAIFAICVAAAKAYKVMAKGDELDVLDVLRPIAFAFVLSIWPAVCNTLIAPGQYLESYMRSQYVKAAEFMDDLQDDRNTMANKVFQEVTNKKANAEFKGEWALVPDAIEESIHDIKNTLSNGLMLMGLWICIGLEWIFVKIGQMVFGVCVYIVFLVKVLYITVLWMFGPIWMVCSILDVWKNQWSEWIGRLVSVSMYGAIAYLIMTFSCYMIIFTLQADIQKLNTIQLNPEIGFFAYLKSGFGTTIMTFVGYLVGAIAMGSTYELASLTFPSQAMHGASSFIGGMKSKAIKYTGTKSAFGS